MAWSAKKNGKSFRIEFVFSILTLKNLSTYLGAIDSIGTVYNGPVLSAFLDEDDRI